NPLALLAPEAVGVGRRTRVHVAIFGVIGVSAPAPFRRNVVNLLRNLLCHGLVHWASSTPGPAPSPPPPILPLPKFAPPCSTLGRELRNRRTLASLSF